MLIERQYEVAGFRIAVEMPQAHPLWERMTNYAPFAAGASDAAPLFRLTLAEALPERALEALWVEDPEPGIPLIRLYKAPGGMLCAEMAPHGRAPLCGRLEIDAGMDAARLQLLCPETDGSAMHFALNNAMMLVFAFATARCCALEMHASVVRQGGRGYLFLGRSGTGKSTHSSLWLRHIPGTELLNDDNPVLRVMPDGSVRVFGSPWSGKTPCYKAADAPVGAIVRIRQAPFNRITPLPGVQAYASVYSSCSAFRPLRDLADGWHETIAAIAGSVPCYVLDCLPDEDAARICHAAVCGSPLEG